MSSINNKTLSDRLFSKKITIGITGLSQSGKSTFITSFINQLLNHKTANLAGFEPASLKYLDSVKLHDSDIEGVNNLPYEDSYSKLCSTPPSWPESTKDITACTLELRLSRPSHKQAPWKSKQYSLFIEIRDYPGEWLLDLPLLDMSFARWSAQCAAQCTASPRRELMGPLLDEIQSLNPLDTIDSATLERLNKAYKDFLKRCKTSDKPLSLIQPGRFLLPGEGIDASLLGFIPLFSCSTLTEAQQQSAKSDSYLKQCEKLYDRYVKELVTPFYKSHFKRIDRQIVLIDVLSILNNGQPCLNDARQALANLSDSFSYGHQSRIMQLFSPKIDSVIFAATKVDEILSEDHSSSRKLLQFLVKEAYDHAAYAGIAPKMEAIAAIRSTKEGEYKGEPALFATSFDQEAIAYTHPHIPEKLPTDDDEWKELEEWQRPNLSPPNGVSKINDDAIPHIRLDLILQQLLGDIVS